MSWTTVSLYLCWVELDNCLSVAQLVRARQLSLCSSVDLFPNEQNFDLDKSRQKFHHSLKEHHKIIFRSFVAKCCKMRII
jgi:hypothetical protein